jgi:adenylate cyclase
MPDLIARDDHGNELWRKTLPDRPVTLGRLAEKAEWTVPEAMHISSLHATLHWRDGRLHVRRRTAPPTTNPIMVGGHVLDEFTLDVGGSFTIGPTTFEVAESAKRSEYELELTVSHGALHKVRFSDPERRIEALARLPQVIRGATPAGEADDTRLEEQVVDVLLDGLGEADVAAVVYLPPNFEPARATAVPVRFGRRRDGPGEVRPSRRLVQRAVERRESVLHTRPGDGGGPAGPEPTQPTDTDWQICAPLLDDDSQGLGLFIAGRAHRYIQTEDSLARDEQLKGVMRYLELTADVYGTLREVRRLQRRDAALARFLSRPVRAALLQTDRQIEEILRPQVADVAVLFCDLRKSCEHAAGGAADLPARWEALSAALRIMTDAIIGQRGVIGDFQGDAAMGFWGWPFRQDDQACLAAAAAWTIRERFEQENRFQCGLGLAVGKAMAGRLGTPDQIKVGVFGPVVNLAARLESMTKQFGVSILVDEAAAVALNATGDPQRRCRPLACVRPVGLDPLTVHELIGERRVPGLLDYDVARKDVAEGRWADARGRLKKLNDGPSKFLTDFLRTAPDAPPADWDGVIPLKSK